MGADHTDLVSPERTDFRIEKQGLLYINHLMVTGLTATGQTDTVVTLPGAVPVMVKARVEHLPHQDGLVGKVGHLQGDTLIRVRIGIKVLGEILLLGGTHGGPVKAARSGLIWH